jgi:hypothetical protein
MISAEDSAHRPQHLPVGPRQAVQDVVQVLLTATRRRLMSSISNRGMGTSRDWCVFGVDQIMCPLTSDTDSDTRSRRPHQIDRAYAQRGTLAERSPHSPCTKIISRYAPA